MQQCGSIITRTIFDPNEVVVYDDYAEVILYDRQCNEKGRSLIDIEDIGKIKLFKWNIDNDGYVVSKVEKTKEVSYASIYYGM